MILIDTPNADQAKAEDEFVDFLLSPTEREMRLIGPGGTGKSWTVKRLITKALKVYQENCQVLGLEPEYTNYILTALTNKAAQSLQDQTGLEVVTIHSWLGLTIKPNYQTGAQDLKRSANWTIKEKYLIFIDEVYMTDSKLYAELQASTMGCKFVYIGDDKQLDPVGEGISPIRNLNVRTTELTIPVRNAGSQALKDLCQLLRDNVAGCVAEAELGIPWTWPKLFSVPGEIDHITEDADLAALLAGPFLQPTGTHLITAFSNQRVNDYNNHMRILRGQTTMFQPNEILISNDLYEKNRFRIRNEQMVELVEANPTITPIQLGDLTVPAQYTKILGYPDHLIPTIIDRDFHQQAMKWAAKEKNWHTYFALKGDFADFRPRDACTVHKSQGSTKDVVLVDLNNIGSCNFTVMTARMLYVAVSRARYRVIFYGNLPEKYGGPFI